MRNWTLRLTGASAADPSSVEADFDELRRYSMRIDGEPRRQGAAQKFVTAVPPGCRPRDKYAFLADVDGLSAGLLDIIDG